MAPSRTRLALGSAVVVVPIAVVSLVLMLGLAGALRATDRLDHARQSGPAVREAGGYGWPVKPFHRQHPVRGAFGDPRTVFAAPPTIDGVLFGAGRFAFHFGVDIAAPAGTPVYPVRDGKVAVASFAPRREKVSVASRDGVVFTYWHIRPLVHVGEWVTKERTVLGTILRPSNHVDLSKVQGGRNVNPLAVGELTPYTDTTVPSIEAVTIRTADALHEALPNAIRGRVVFVVEAVDTAAIPVPGSWHAEPQAPALIRWSIKRATGKVVVPTRTAVDFRTKLPDDAVFWSVYARGTYQNMTAFAKHYSYLQPGRFLFRLTMTPFDTHRLRDGVYDLVVTATDIRGNSDTRVRRFTVENQSGGAKSGL
jgi:hypothetical protein